MILAKVAITNNVRHGIRFILDVHGPINYNQTQKAQNRSPKKYEKR
jgi:hypothetical protein